MANFNVLSHLQAVALQKLQEEHTLTRVWEWRLNGNGVMSLCAYNCLGHCWRVWIITRRGKVSMSALLPSAVTKNLPLKKD